MVLIIVLEYLFLSVPVVCFCVAAAIELHSKSRDLTLLVRIGEMALGTTSLLAIPSRFWGITSISPYNLSWTMVCVSLVTGCAAFFSKYTSRRALSLVIFGNTFLAFLWYLNGAYRH